MLKEILSVSGKPGLYKLISQGKNMFIGESLIDKKRIPIYARDKVVSLQDIAIYTEGDDLPLGELFTMIKEKENGKEISINLSGKPDELKAYFKEILPNYDEYRVYPTDIKKALAWYNLLIKNDMTDFNAKESEEQESKEETAQD